jgi:hypothetical protein
MEFRIGDRDPVTGLYYVIYPDGSSTLNGMKIFNAAHQLGDVVRATQRSDGMIALDSAKAYQIPTTDKSISIKEFGKVPTGYLQGQVFNQPEAELNRNIRFRLKLLRYRAAITGQGGTPFTGIQFGSDTLYSAISLETAFSLGGSNLFQALTTPNYSLPFNSPFNGLYSTQISPDLSSGKRYQYYGYGVVQARAIAYSDLFPGVSSGDASYVFPSDFATYQVPNFQAALSIVNGSSYNNWSVDDLNMPYDRQPFVQLGITNYRYNNVYHVRSVNGVNVNRLVLQGMLLARIDNLDPRQSGWVTTLASPSPVATYFTPIVIDGSSYVP